MPTLAERVEQQDYTAQRDAHARGEAALVELEPLLAHGEAEVRELAALCVGEAGGARAVELLLPRLHDDDPQVAMAALQGIARHAQEPQALALLRAHDAGVDPEVGPELVLLLGGFEATLQPLLQSGELRKRYHGARDPQVSEAWQAVLAQLGDEAARRDFVEALLASREAERKRLLERSERIGGVWLLPALDPVLDDLTPLLRVGVDARPDLIDTLRARELAMLAVDAIAKRDPSTPPFQPSFTISRSVQYSDAAAHEVQQWLRGLPRPPAIYGNPTAGTP
jgi:HEAT repeat protein